MRASAFRLGCRTALPAVVTPYFFVGPVAQEKTISYRTSWVELGDMKRHNSVKSWSVGITAQVASSPIAQDYTVAVAAAAAAEDRCQGRLAAAVAPIDLRGKQRGGGTVRGRTE